MCYASSLEIKSLERHNPGHKPRFLSQNIAQNDPLKNIPSIQENATNRSAKLSESLIHFIIQFAFFYIQGIS